MDSGFSDGVRAVWSSLLKECQSAVNGQGESKVTTRGRGETRVSICSGCGGGEVVVRRSSESEAGVEARDGVFFNGVATATVGHLLLVQQHPFLTLRCPQLLGEELNAGFVAILPPRAPPTKAFEAASAGDGQCIDPGCRGEL